MKKLIPTICCILISANALSNVYSEIHNDESAFLVSDRDSISKYEEAKWSVYFGAATNYRLQPTLFTWWEPIFILGNGLDVLIYRQIHSCGYLGTGIFYNQYVSKAKWINGLGLYNESSMSNRIIGLPIIYSLNIYPKSRIYPSIQVGLALTKLLNNTSEIVYSDGSNSKNIEYKRGSNSIFFLSEMDVNFKLSSTLTALISLHYLQQTTSYEKSNTNIDFGLDRAQIFQLGAGIKYGF